MKLLKLLTLATASFIFSSNAVANSAWFQDFYKDEFTDKKFTMYRTESINGQFLSLKCGMAPYGKYYEPSIAFHSNSITQAGKTYPLKIRVDKREAISRNAWASPLTTNKFIQIEWGNEKGNAKEVTDKIATDFNAGNRVLVQIANKPSFNVSLSGFTKAFNATHKKCQSLAEKNNGRYFSKVWLPVD
ncbi:hypothetical protein [Vibrio sp. B1Z05]|uniref:hypothetical protein n=1 Tax=Vibrio sp. B1Z05 TaxID=2654980 RepID=UPI00128CB7F2|nr:hypothetical protein [Vibrio sp. B1Z05]MPW37404.1 hypothetical protein [Vibrio sp. B1Z05]